MEISMRSKYIVAAVALSVGVGSSAWSADEPAQPATAPAAQAATQPAAQAAPTPQAAASSTSTEAAAKTPAKETATAASSTSEADAQEKHLLAAGYKKKTQNGQTVYCRKEMPLGSRFEKEHCGSAQDMELQAQQARDLMNSSRMSQGSRTN
jgi:hypothetical protein